MMLGPLLVVLQCLTACAAPFLQCRVVVCMHARVPSQLRRQHVVLQQASHRPVCSLGCRGAACSSLCVCV